MKGMSRASQIEKEKRSNAPPIEEEEKRG